MPAFIESKARRGQIGLAHLSDYVRAFLLDEYGGLWIDATVMCTQPLPASMLSRRLV